MTTESPMPAHGPPGPRLLRNLTPAEQDVAALIARGLDYRAIGASLHISPKTASVHVHRIADKLSNPESLKPYKLVLRWMLTQAA